MNIVQFERGDSMNNVVTSKEAILEVSRKLIQEKGWSAVNIRAVASAGNISVGSVYNYFSSKSELVTATIESIWLDIFHAPAQRETFSDFLFCIEWIYDRLEKGSEKYPDFFKLHSMSFVSTDKTDGKQRMSQSWIHIQNHLLGVLKSDTKIRSDAFDDVFTAEKLVSSIFSILYFSLLRKDYDASAVVEMVRRLIY